VRSNRRATFDLASNRENISNVSRGIHFCAENKVLISTHCPVFGVWIENYFAHYYYENYFAHY
jgi:hypothetical protein